MITRSSTPKAMRVLCIEHRKRARWRISSEAKKGHACSEKQAVAWVLEQTDAPAKPAPKSRPVRAAAKVTKVPAKRARIAPAPKPPTKTERTQRALAAYQVGGPLGPVRRALHDLRKAPAAELSASIDAVGRALDALEQDPAVRLWTALGPAALPLLERMGARK
jgi:hypothetical protein